VLPNVGRHGQFGRFTFGRYENEAGSRLRKTEIRPVENVEDRGVSGGPQSVHEVPEDHPTSEIQQSRHILHRHHVGFRGYDQVRETAKQLPVGVFVLLIIGRKRLAGRAANQDLRVSLEKEIRDFFGGQGSDIPTKKGGVQVGGIWVPARFIDVDPGNDVKAFLLKSKGQAPGTTKDVNDGCYWSGNRHCPTALRRSISSASSNSRPESLNERRMSDRIVSSRSTAKALMAFFILGETMICKVSSSALRVMRTLQK
jgi:hypothetical protein